MDVIGPPAPVPRQSRDAAVTALFRSEHGRLVAYARLFVDDRQTAEDVVQESFAGLYRRWHVIADEQAACAYLRTAVANGCRSALRRRRTSRGFRPPPPEDAPSAEAVVVRREDHRQVLAGLARLPLRQREVLVLRYFFDLTETQIAAELAISRGAVKQHAARGLSSLSTCIGAAL